MELATLSIRVTTQIDTDVLLISTNGLTGKNPQQSTVQLAALISYSSPVSTQHQHISDGYSATQEEIVAGYSSEE